MTDENLLLLALAAPALSLLLAWRFAQRWFFRTTLIAAFLCWGATALILHFEDRCSGTLIFGYRGCGWLADDVSSGAALIALLLILGIAAFWSLCAVVLLTAGLWRKVVSRT